MSGGRGGGALVVAGVAIVALAHFHGAHLLSAASKYVHGAHLLSAVSTTAAGTHGGTLGCSGLENLWEQAGGSPAAAVTAASVAMAESSGRQYARSGTDDIGYWQINASTWGSLATYDPIDNAKASIQISRNGTDWSPWVTYNSGAYQGKC